MPEKAFFDSHKISKHCYAILMYDNDVGFRNRQGYRTGLGGYEQLTALKIIIIDSDMA